MIRNALKNMADFVSHVYRYNDIDVYLSRATSHEDLERRIRQLQREGKL